MNFFDLIRSLLFNKKLRVEDVDSESLQHFLPFMINRWLSFYDRNAAVFTNETLNRFVGLFDDKTDQFNLYNNLIPRFKFKKIEYIKKSKDKKEEEDISIERFAKNNMLSKREVNYYIDLINITAK